MEKPKERIRCVNEIKGNIWEHFYEGTPIVIPTNGNRDKFGYNVMGKGLAKEAKELFSKLPSLIGKGIKQNKGINRVFLYSLPTDKVDSKGNKQYGLLFAFPSKINYWDEKSSIILITKSAIELVKIVNTFSKKLGIEKVILPRVGCGCGLLNWETEVKPILEKILDDRFSVIKYDENWNKDPYSPE